MGRIVPSDRHGVPDSNFWRKPGKLVALHNHLTEISPVNDGLTGAVQENMT